METQFPDIFQKLQKLDTRINTPVREVWRQVDPITYQCKVTGRRLMAVEFLRYQYRIGVDRFVVEVMK